MRFLRQGDQSKTVLAMSTVWFVLLLGLVPAVVVLQIIAPEAFRLWTHGKLEFDPLIFAMISMSILVYALTQPAMAIVQGQNLLKVQMVLSSFTAIIMVGGLIVLVPSIGLTAAAMVLLLAELANLVGFVVAAHRWMKANRLQWPHRTFGLSGIAVAIGCAALAGIAFFPGNAVWVTVGGATVGLAAVVLGFARSLPEVPGNHLLARALALVRPRVRAP
jgi:O-antigen/teichoic acid export membrane protein